MQKTGARLGASQGVTLGYRRHSRLGALRPPKCPLQPRCDVVLSRKGNARRRRLGSCGRPRPSRPPTDRASPPASSGGPQARTPTSWGACSRFALGGSAGQAGASGGRGGGEAGRASAPPCTSEAGQLPPAPSSQPEQDTPSLHRTYAPPSSGWLPSVRPLLHFSPPYGPPSPRPASPPRLVQAQPARQGVRAAPRDRARQGRLSDAHQRARRGGESASPAAAVALRRWPKHTRVAGAVATAQAEASPGAGGLGGRSNGPGLLPPPLRPASD